MHDMARTKYKKLSLEKSLTEMRDYKIVKSNDLIQKVRFQLSLQEQKIVLYLISKIKPEDIELKEHNFSIPNFCDICGMDKDNGGNYAYLKQTMKLLSDKSAWITKDDGSETLFRWINSVTIEKNSGLMTVGLNEMLKPYLLQLQERFTQYELIYTLAMRSQYSVRLYEILKSYEYQHKKIFDISALKRLISADNYERFPDFKRKVLEISIREINELSDINVTYEIIKEGRKYTKIEFSMSVKKDMGERFKTWVKIEKIINPSQANLHVKPHGENL
jgi:plasmid replication initiation protein